MPQLSPPVHHPPLSTDRAAAEPRAGAPGRLAGLLAARVSSDPDCCVLRKVSGQGSRGGDQPATWSAAEALGCVERLSGRLSRLGLPGGAPVGLCLGGPEAALTLMAAEAAGLVPVLLPLVGTWDAVARAVERLGIAAVVTQTELVSERPAQRLSEIAAGYFGLRFLLAFGPGIPDGVGDLTPELLASDRAEHCEHRWPDDGAGSAARASTGVVTFASPLQVDKPMFRTMESLAAATLGLVACIGLRAGDRLVSLLASDDLKGLATGLMPALLTGASFEPHPVFCAEALHSSLFAAPASSAKRCHLVAPAWLETYLARLDLPDWVATIMFVHTAPTRFQAAPPLRPRIVDVLAFDEVAIVAAPRHGTGPFTPALDSGPDIAKRLLSIEIGPAGTLSFAGPAAAAQPWVGQRDPGRDALSGAAEGGFAAEIYGDRLIGVRRTPEHSP